MPNKWIEFVKKTASEKNISYKESLKVSKDLYTKGSSVNSNVVRMIYMKNPNKFNVNKVKNPSQHLQGKSKRRPTANHIQQRLSRLKATGNEREIKQIINELRNMLNTHYKTMSERYIQDIEAAIKYYSKK